MLVLHRKANESLLIGGDIRITIVECGSGGVKLAIDAPKQFSILREELSEAAMNNKEALSPDVRSIRSLKTMLLAAEEEDSSEEENGDPE